MKASRRWACWTSGRWRGRPRGSWPPPARGARPAVTSHWLAVLLSAALGTVAAADANRLTYLDDHDPFYVHLRFPKLATPQWIGEAGVDAVVILAIDDLRTPAKYELFLRPLLNRLEQLEGRAAVSIMCNALDPRDPQFQAWLREGVSLEVHTLTHPCPLLAGGDFHSAVTNYWGGIELLDQIPGNQARAFRTPCCDSIDSASPRLFAELFNRTGPAGQFLTLDSSVMDLLSAKDPALPPALVTEPNGGERFRKYLPFPSFTTTVENYPYPYVLGRLGWELPAAVPSDWEAFHLHGATNPATVADWKAALDATLIKQGTFTMIFHPHGWIRSDQLVELIDYAAAKYGRRVRFLNFRETQQRLDRNLLAGQPLRAANGQDNGVRLLDLDNDGYLDVVIGNEHRRQTRLWDPQAGLWRETGFPTALVTVDTAGNRHEAGVRFGIVPPGRATIAGPRAGPGPGAAALGDGALVMLVRSETGAGAWRFMGGQWTAAPALLKGLELDGQPLYTCREGHDCGVRLRDIDGDGCCELIVGNASQNAVFAWGGDAVGWVKQAYALPGAARLVDAEGRDNGLRFVDVNGDGYPDVLFSNASEFSLHLYVPRRVLGWSVGWSREVMAGRAGEPGAIPLIVRGSPPRDNGVWFRGEGMWVQNEDTTALLDHVDHRTFQQLLAGLLTPPKPPREALATLRARPGFRVELVASEPLLESPVAFDWSADGKLWVVEMRDYPLGLDGKGKPGGRVRCLEATHGDGHYDKSTIFLDGLNFPNGLIPWRKGVLISAPPNILYAEDTNGDGKADVCRTLFTGFREGNQQHRANGYDYGLDNWLYGANGDSGGRVRSLLTGKVTDISYRDFRFRPDTGEFETQAGQTQYGRHRDDWGNWFGNENAVGSWHYYLPEQYVARNPYLSVRSAKHVMPNYPNYTRVYPLSRLAQRFNDPQTANHLTSANSTMPYRDDLFGPGFATSYFVSEPVHNLVHREVLEPAGVTFTSHRAADERQSEFLASSDNWFRPTMTRTGPDGALYVADMYRLVIEHPEWIPADFQRSVDLRAGADLGRLYRVYPTNATPRPMPRLDRLGPTRLVAAMESPNGWQRDTVQRLLVTAADPAAVAPLARLAERSPNPKTRVQALCTLDGLHALTPGRLRRALRDPDPRVREQAIRLSEPLLDRSPQLGRALAVLVADPAPRVRYQLAFSLGEWHRPEAGQALARLALANLEAEPIQTAVLSSAVPHVSELITAILARRPPLPGQDTLLARLVGLAASLGEARALGTSLVAITQPSGSGYEAWQLAALGGLLEAMDRRHTTLAALVSGPSETRTPPSLTGLFAYARQRATDPQSGDEERMAAIRLVGRDTAAAAADLKELGGLLDPRNPPAIQAAALDRLGALRGDEVAEVLVAAWPGIAPAARARTLDLLMSRPAWTRVLLAAVEAQRVAAGALGMPRQQQLLRHPQAAIREQAQRLFARANANRAAVIRQYQVVQRLRGDPVKGAGYFRQNCTPCHRFQNEGNELGPDLGSVAFKPVDYLVTAILDPSQSFETRYTGYTAATKEDQEYSGLIVNESANSLTLRLAGGNEVVILRRDLRALTSSGRSLMPDGFENSLPPQALADVLAYLTSGSSPGAPLVPAAGP